MDKQQLSTLSIIGMVAIVSIFALLTMQQQRAAITPAGAANIGGEAIFIKEPYRIWPQPIEPRPITGGTFTFISQENHSAINCSYHYDNYDPFTAGYVRYMTYHAYNNTNISQYQSDRCIDSNHLIEWSCWGPSVATETLGKCSAGCANNKCNHRHASTPGTTLPIREIR